MFNPNPPVKTNLDRAIDEVLHSMEDLPADSEEYAQMVDQLVKLHNLKTEEGRKKVSPDVKANILANIAITLAIISHERAHIITTKAFSFIRRLG